MKTRRTIVTVVVAAALGAAIISPVSAGPPEFFGVIICDSYGNDDNPMSGEGWWTKKSIAAYKRNTPAMDDCAPGSIGFLTIEQQG